MSIIINHLRFEYESSIIDNFREGNCFHQLYTNGEIVIVGVNDLREGVV